ncbi:hypothetical protein PPYR_03760 [Photinus pyralis]|uniref:Uncharacterized protein n=1 Tax=Photinus pyralis TaxID=7054 RepID=A0A5N4AW64_PHOPY|nr:hypothetical protein PPYR_03760 [Photinus pyralis]
MDEKIDVISAAIKTLTVTSNETVGRVAKVEADHDALEQYTRRNNLRISGILETANENCDQLVVQFLENKLNITCTELDIERTHRVGKRQDGVKRAIIVKFASYRKRAEIFASKKLLKKTGFLISEDLTALRYQLYKQYCEIYAKPNVWTTDGRIHYIDKNNSHQILKPLDYIIKK